MYISCFNDLYSIYGMCIPSDIGLHEIYYGSVIVARDMIHDYRRYLVVLNRDLPCGYLNTLPRKPWPIYCDLLLSGKLTNKQFTMENYYLYWENSTYMAIFNSYVSLLEDKHMIPSMPWMALKS